MKLTEVPPTPARPTYRLELTFDELVTDEASLRAGTINLSHPGRELGGGGTYDLRELGRGVRITVVHPSPSPPPTYRLELTQEELVGLGLLSFRHETALRSFYGTLPWDVQNDVQASARGRTDAARTNTGVAWKAS